YQMSIEPAIKYISVSDLHFDRKNPRLVEYDISPKASDDDILKILWDAMDVRELVQSISASGFFPHEALIVAIERGQNIVIEGNRRLAAVKTLLSPQDLTKKNGWNVPKISAGEQKKLVTLPAIISARKDSWRYLGFKHVNGPAKWTSFAKAAYIAEVRREYGIPLADIAAQIGDGYKTVQRLYRGLMVLEQAERNKIYDREDRYRKRLAFSHLYTGIELSGISSFLDISDDAETTEPVPKGKLTELGELCVWLYGSKKQARQPVVESQNPDLRNLNTVLSNRDGIAALRAGTDLSKAVEISRSPAAVFEEALLAAKRELTTASAYLTAGYDKSQSLLRTAGTVAEIADDIYSEMERKFNPKPKKSRLTES
ncbi:MAG: hypothetical protein HOP19_18595, partial [Acidobacteria bacterium]|nr:hypothetical protein [Acidobacteriota bacterium]